MKPSSKEKSLAGELAQSLGDVSSLELYESYVRRYPETLLRTILREVMSVPDYKIKKSRAALFNYLVRKYGR